MKTHCPLLQPVLAADEVVIIWLLFFHVKVRGCHQSSEGGEGSSTYIYFLLMIPISKFQNSMKVYYVTHL